MWLKKLSFEIISLLFCRSGGVFPMLPKLTELSFSFMPKLTHIGAGAFSNLVALQHLHAQSNLKLCSIHERAFSRPGKENPYHEEWPPITSVRNFLSLLSDPKLPNFSSQFSFHSSHLRSSFCTTIIWQRFRMIYSIVGTKWTKSIYVSIIGNAIVPINGWLIR